MVRDEPQKSQHAAWCWGQEGAGPSEHLAGREPRQASPPASSSRLWTEATKRSLTCHVTASFTSGEVHTVGFWTGTWDSPRTLLSLSFWDTDHCLAPSKLAECQLTSGRIWVLPTCWNHRCMGIASLNREGGASNSHARLTSSAYLGALALLGVWGGNWPCFWDNRLWACPPVGLCRGSRLGPQRTNWSWGPCFLLWPLPALQATCCPQMLGFPAVSHPSILFPPASHRIRPWDYISGGKCLLFKTTCLLQKPLPV